MKKLCAFLALVLSLAFAGVTLAQDKPAAAPDKPAAAEVKKEEAKPAPTPNKGDVSWMLVSTALVLMMSVPGLALFYGGMVRKKNVLATVMQSFAICCLVTILWWLVGYSLAFTPGSTAYFGGFGRAFMDGVVYLKDAGKVSVSHLGLTVPETVYAMFQLTFAIITPALIAGAFAERMKFSAMLWFMGTWSIVVYAPIAHWVW
ncbi:MAG: ammonium transporter, partial [Pseudomonadota bacterium]